MAVAGMEGVLVRIYFRLGTLSSTDERETLNSRL